MASRGARRRTLCAGLALGGAALLLLLFPAAAAQQPPRAGEGGDGGGARGRGRRGRGWRGRPLGHAVLSRRRRTSALPAGLSGIDSGAGGRADGPACVRRLVVSRRPLDGWGSQGWSLGSSAGEGCLGICQAVSPGGGNCRL